MTQGGDPPVSMQGIRNALHVRVEETSLRQVAREVDVSPTGLTHFLRGARPYRPVRDKLQRWWDEGRHRAPEAVRTDLARVAIADLVGPLPPAMRHATIRGMLAVVAAGHRRGEVVPPGWLPELCAEFGVPETP